MGVANSVSIDKSKKTEKDFYQTPEVCVEALIKTNSFKTNQKFLDPCCGHGAISSVFKRFGFKIKENDLFL